jgi:hypothetical protein
MWIYNVMQEAIWTPSFRFVPREWEPEAEGGSIFVNIRARNITWDDPVIADSNVDWLTISDIERDNSGNGIFTLTAAANDTNESRTATVTVLAEGGITYKFVVTQDMKMVTMNYRILANTMAVHDVAINTMSFVRDLFQKAFRIDLVMYDSSLWFSPLLDEVDNCPHGREELCRADTIPAQSCGSNRQCATAHHKSRDRFLTHFPSNGITPVFRFVDFSLCRYAAGKYVDGKYVDGSHDGVYGAAERLGYNTIQSTANNAGDGIRRTTAHEIAHLFGARDHGSDNGIDIHLCAPREFCMMRNRGDNLTSFEGWCSTCTAVILSNRGRP